MKKRSLILMLVLCVAMTLFACAAAEIDPGVTTAPKLPPEGTSAPITEAEYLPDFTVQTVDGGTFTLSEALKDHELVLINLFATWCAPCRMEFPYLEAAWEQEMERVAVIALSIEPADTDAQLKTYAEDMGLRFPVGSETGTGLSRFVTGGIPTTILVDRTGKVAAVEIGAKTSTQAFLDLFDDFSGADYDPSLCAYRVCAYGTENYEEIEGLVVNFCTDAMCTPVTTGADGVACFKGAPAEYHVQVVSVPDGWRLAGDSEWTTEPFSQTFWVPCREAGQ